MASETNMLYGSDGASGKKRVGPQIASLISEYRRQNRHGFNRGAPETPERKRDGAAGELCCM
ncbi:hypothetical protein F2Q70_00011027 [Brassica cretica]|uniref:Uncharacterized protein n=1 Tax=Brassica cretica TaxID=69181 RepID=A0A8S9M3P8_BRACR|nr:hypothetical protein F2Q70_00011027 [Brassica cretica]